MNAKLVRSGHWKCSFSFVYTHMTQQCGKSSMQKCMLHFQECLSVEWLVFLRFVGVHTLVKPTNHCCFNSCRQAVDTVLHLVWSLTVLQLAAATAVAIATRSIYTWSAIAMKSKTSWCVNSFFFFSITAIGNRLLYVRIHLTRSADFDEWIAVCIWMRMTKKTMKRIVVIHMNNSLIGSIYLTDHNCITH